MWAHALIKIKNKRKMIKEKLIYVFKAHKTFFKIKEKQ